MRRTGELQESFLSFENFYYAFKKAFKATKTQESWRFAFQLEEELKNLIDELSAGSYIPGKYRYFEIFEPKPRTISAAPFRDRVVHHALIRQLEPIFEQTFIFDSYATRKNKGTHAAARRAQNFCRKNIWYLKMDIRHYFASINHEKLVRQIARTIKDPFVLNLCRQIIAQGGDGSKGLPIGNLTSQFFANVYLTSFDHMVKEELHVRHYIRYMDDFILFGNDRSLLKNHLVKIQNFLYTNAELTVKFAYMNKCTGGIPWLGLRIFPNLIRIQRKNLQRTRTKIKKRHYEYKHGLISEESYSQSLAAVYGLRAGFGIKGVIFSLKSGQSAKPDLL